MDLQNITHLRSAELSPWKGIRDNIIKELLNHVTVELHRREFRMLE